MKPRKAERAAPPGAFSLFFDMSM